MTLPIMPPDREPDGGGIWPNKVGPHIFAFLLAATIGAFVIVFMSAIGWRILP